MGDYEDSWGKRHPGKGRSLNSGASVYGFARKPVRVKRGYVYRMRWERRRR